MAEIINGIGYGAESGAIFDFLASNSNLFQPTVKRTPTKPIADTVNSDWAYWGSNNQQPLAMREHIENCGVLNAGIDAKSRITVGKGVEPFYKVGVDAEGKEILEWCGDKEIQDFFEANDLFNLHIDQAFDTNGYGWSAGRLLKGLGGDRISRIERIDVYDARVSKPTIEKPYSEHLYLCDDWAKAGNTFSKEKQVKLNMLREGYELEQLKDKQGEWAFINRKQRNGRQNYANPLWWSNEQWVKVARSVPEYKNALFLHQITLRYVVTIHPMYWETVKKGFATQDEKTQKKLRKDTYTRIDQWLAGKYNAGKSLFTEGFTDMATNTFTPYITVTEISDKLKDGKLLPDSAAANSEILFALCINPALMGAGQPGGAYSNNAGGSNVRESYLTQLMMNDASRREISRILNVIKQYNGWSKRLEKDNKRIVFRFQSGLLTTLDTGKSTKNETVG